MGKEVFSAIYVAQNFRKMDDIENSKGQKCGCYTTYIYNCTCVDHVLEIYIFSLEGIEWNKICKNARGWEVFVWKMHTKWLKIHRKCDLSMNF